MARSQRAWPETPRCVCLVSGLGSVFGENRSFLGAFRQAIVTALYRLALRVSDKTWFQNPDDCQICIERNIIRECKSLVIKSGGINLQEYSPTSVQSEQIAELKAQLGVPTDSKCVVMIAARMIWSKGVAEFIHAAHSLKKYFPEWHFVMLTPEDTESDESVPRSYIEKHTSDNLVVVDCFRPDVKVFTAMADILVLPSYYREGVPRSLLEGMALKKPLVTTDSPGCREVVRDGHNGFLTPPKDKAALVEKIEILLNDADKRILFGINSREFARNTFSEEIVVGRVISELYGIRQGDSTVPLPSNECDDGITEDPRKKSFTITCERSQTIIMSVIPAGRLSLRRPSRTILFGPT